MSSKELPGEAPGDWVEEVLRFWFEELSERDWFRGSALVDEKCGDRFGSLYATLKNHPPQSMDADARTLLAAVIVFDQFPRNMFRRTPEAYGTDNHALALARAAVASGKDRSLSPKQRQFLYMPFMHSEDRAAQAESVRLFTELGIAGEHEVRASPSRRGPALRPFPSSQRHSGAGIDGRGAGVPEDRNSAGVIVLSAPV